MRQNFADPDAFAKVMKMTKHTGLWNVTHNWYSPSLLLSEHSFGINCFRLTWPCLIVEVLATQANFFQSSVYCTMMKCTFTFRKTNDFLPSRLGLYNTPAASLQRGKIPPNEEQGCDTKQYEGETPVMLELWGMRSTPLLPLLPGPLW